MENTHRRLRPKKRRFREQIMKGKSLKKSMKKWQLSKNILRHLITPLTVSGDGALEDERTFIVDWSMYCNRGPKRVRFWMGSVVLILQRMRRL
ncbi:hypothetical protein TNCV_1671631 [Trichonephila clavipes]|nr:hypothetical protein TNCV_1671631 [Trichonephila clavipes]